MTHDNGFGHMEATQESNVIVGLLEASQIALIAVDSALEVVSWSAAAKLIFGWDEKEVIGRSISLLAPDGRLEGSLGVEPDTRVRFQHPVSGAF